MSEHDYPRIAGGVVLSDAQLKRRRQRNVAIGLTVGLLCLIFYVVTIIKIGPDIMRGH